MGAFTSVPAAPAENEEEHIISDILKARAEIPVFKPSDFEIIEHVADGGYGSVFKARCKVGKLSGKLVALKFFGYVDNRPSSDYIENNEIICDWELNQLSCTPKVFGYFFDTKSGLVADYVRENPDDESAPCTGKKWPGAYPVKVSQCLEKDILSALQGRVYFSERDASIVFRNIIEAIDEIHKAGIIHRDLNPQNIMFENDPADTEDPRRLDIKLIDFGFAIKHPSGSELSDGYSRLGTSGYAAPESCFRKVHSRKTDVWQVGVTLFVIIFQKLPFQDEKFLTPESNYFKYQLPELRKMNRMSEDGLKLLSGIFDSDPTKRLSCEQILRHPWVRNSSDLSDTDFGPEFRENVKQWVYRRNLCKVFNDRYSWSQMVRRKLDALLRAHLGDIKPISPAKFSSLKRHFLKVSSVDTGSTATGGINYQQFCSILETCKMDEFCSGKIFGVFDMDRSGRVDYFEFLLALSSYRKDPPQETEDQQAEFYFDIFDINCDGFIDRYGTGNTCLISLFKFVCCFRLFSLRRRSGSSFDLF